MKIFLKFPPANFRYIFCCLDDLTTIIYYQMRTSSINFVVSIRFLSEIKNCIRQFSKSSFWRLKRSENLLKNLLKKGSECGSETLRIRAVAILFPTVARDSPIFVRCHVLFLTVLALHYRAADVSARDVNYACK